MCSVFSFDLDTGDVVRPSSGIPRELSGVLVPWPGEVSSLVRDRLRLFTLTRLVRRANDMARPDMIMRSCCSVILGSAMLSQYFRIVRAAWISNLF